MTRQTSTARIFICAIFYHFFLRWEGGGGEPDGTNAISGLSSVHVITCEDDSFSFHSDLFCGFKGKGMGKWERERNAGVSMLLAEDKDFVSMLLIKYKTTMYVRVLCPVLCGWGCQ
jgi:hypothetical protein